MRILRLAAVHLDTMGAGVSGLCLVHCVSMPLIFAFAPTLAHFIPGDEAVHRLLAFLVVGAGLPSFVIGYQKHKKWAALVLGLAGMSIVLGALVFGDSFTSHVVDVSITMLGSLLLTSAHLVNRTFCRRCRRCGHS
jgi:MerC mercury resistance protein